MGYAVSSDEIRLSAVADMDGDGDYDVVGYSKTTIWGVNVEALNIYYNDGKGNFPNKEVVFYNETNYEDVRAITSYDFDKDNVGVSGKYFHNYDKNSLPH